MKEENRKIRLMLENAIEDALNTLKKEHPSTALTNLYIQINQSKKMLSIYDDGDRILKDMHLEEELKDTERLNFFYTNASRLLKEAIINCRNRKIFDDLNILPPVSLIVLDEDGQTLLNYILYDDKISTDNRLMKDLGKDLDLFLKNLLADIE
ncbi:MAG: hypothetical protein FWF54_03515 [Candidatus Azobacteroides sp.]|nr:hypothetical protein [Candidatus Azobacteroides sp.]